MEDETVFIKCLKAHCRLAWNKLHLLNDKMIFDVAFNITKINEDAEDVRANVYKKFLEGIDNFRGESSISTYLHKIAEREAIDFMRNKNCKKNKTEELPYQLDENGDAVEVDVGVTLTNP